MHIFIVSGKAKSGKNEFAEYATKYLFTRHIKCSQLAFADEVKRLAYEFDWDGAKDEKGRKTILDIVKVEERVYPIGRLDYDSSGLLLLTNDGDVYNNIIHPRVEIDKKYIAECKGIFSKQDIEKFEKGLDIGGYVTAPAKIRIISEDLVKNSYISTVEITIYEGKNRQIRRMCSSLNHEVISLKRVSIGDLKLGYLQQGKYRELTKEELQYIKEL